MRRPKARTELEVEPDQETGARGAPGQVADAQEVLQAPVDALPSRCALCWPVARGKCEAGSCVICRRPPGAWRAFVRGALRCCYGFQWGRRDRCQAQQMKLPKFEQRGGLASGRLPLRHRRNDFRRWRRGPGARSLSGPSRALTPPYPLDFLP